MKYFDLDIEEKQLLEDFEKGELVSIGKNKIKKYQAYSTATLNKTRNINIRLSEKDVLRLKTKAIETGIPYQTLVSSILHRFVSK